MNEKNQEEKLKLFVLGIVTVVWTTLMVVSVFKKDFDVPQAVHGLMGLVVGYFVGERIVNKMRS